MHCTTWWLQNYLCSDTCCRVQVATRHPHQLITRDLAPGCWWGNM